ncbi:hypothetical protein BDA99DRAFT_543912 [Phascolomyces articulosus]|uniref:Protein-serine/threonine kinase n=1 Tax=Phascolomyces articulosus TaxID=60185 RepID=A0AAD5JL84_9FUNG|nr:hypothetical protein BDA99DRAFT_543912 [Phascolomyces articulosus]
MRLLLHHLTKRQPLHVQSTTTTLCHAQYRRRFLTTTSTLCQNTSTHKNNNTNEPRAATLDHSIKSSHSPYHFYQTKILEEYVQRPANASTLRQYIFYGRHMTSDRLVHAANWVRNELLTRLAHRIRDFQQLPFFVGMNPHIEFVYRLYWGAFEQLRKQPTVKTLDDNHAFCQCLKELLDDGQLVVPRLALGVSECAQHFGGGNSHGNGNGNGHGNGNGNSHHHHHHHHHQQHHHGGNEESSSQDLDRFMNRMLRSRISRRMLAEQHLALTEAHDQDWDMMGEGENGYVGIIFVRCSASELVSQATRLVRHHAETIYAKALEGEEGTKTKIRPPAIQVQVHQDVHTQGLQQKEKPDEIVFAYVPEHLEYILFELLSNAVRFTMETHSNKKGDSSSSSPYPPVKLTVSANDTDVYFRVSDQGGGIAPDVYKHLWSYQARAPTGQFHHFHQVQKMPSSINERASQAENLGQVHLGMGLTMSRILAEYWGGELQVMTMQGYGTDAYVRIPRLGTKAENLGFEDHPAITPTSVQPGQQREGANHGNNTQDQPVNWYHPSVIQRNTPIHKSDAGDGWSKSCMMLD